MDNGNRTSIYGCYAMGNAHQHTTRKTQNGKHPIHKGKYSITQIAKEKVEREEAIAKRVKRHRYVNVNAWMLFAVVFV